MADSTVKKTSLWRETCRALKLSASDIALPYCGLAVIISILYFALSTLPDGAITQQLRQNPQWLHQHPELTGAYYIEIIQKGGTRSLAWLLFGPPGYYIFTTLYLRLTLKTDRPDYSFQNFFYWFGKVFRKYLRAFWLLLPVIGIYFYARAMMRYLPVSPLAVHREGRELETSWSLTQGNWWRLFGNSCMLGILFAVAIIVVALMVTVPLVIATGMLQLNPQSTLFRLVTSFMQGFGSSVGIVVFSVYNCIVYRVLSQEAQQKQLMAIGSAP